MRPCLMSLTVCGDFPMALPISVRDQPRASSALINSAQVVSMAGTLWDAIGQSQRDAITLSRNNRLMTLGDRIKQARKLRNMSRPQLAEASGVKYPTLAGIENNDQPSSTQLPELAAALRVNVLWLQTGKGPRDAEGVVDQDAAPVPAFAHALALGDGSTPEEYAEAHRLLFRKSSLRKKGLLGRNLEVYYGRGESMEPRIRDGDAILIDRDDTDPRDGEIFVLEADHDGAVAKRLTNIDGRWFFESDNKAEPKWRKPVPLDGRTQWRIIGRVRWIGSWEG